MLELLLLAVGLAMDAAAVAAASAIAHPKASLGNGLRMAAVFGAFQAGMPCIGWAAGSRVAAVAVRYTPWIAFLILFVLGARMIRAAVRAESEPKEGRPNPFAAHALLALGVATSLDALAVGVTLPWIGIPLGRCVAVIGAVTFGIAVLAFRLSHSLTVDRARIGARFEVAGGVALIGVGAKLLLTHLFS